MGQVTWSTQQLTAFLAGVAGYVDEPSALRGGMELTAEAAEAEFAAVFDGDEVVACIGFAGDDVPRAFWDAGAGGCREIDLPGVGRCATLRIPLDQGERSLTMVLARWGDEEFDSEEATLLRGMGRVLGLTLRMLRTLGAEREAREASERHAAENDRLLASLQERERLLSRLSQIQGSISRRAALDEVFDIIIAGAAELLNSPMVGIRLIDPEDSGMLVLCASSGVDVELARRSRRSRVGEGAGGLAVSTRAAVILEGYSGANGSMQDYSHAGVESAMAHPVYENGRVVGSISVASLEPGRVYNDTEKEVLAAFASHASLALTDAQTVDAMNKAFHDPLTGLANRTLFLDRLQTALAERGEEAATGEVGVLFADLDGFKLVNDTLGHSGGDQLLTEVAMRIKQQLRPNWFASRLGGDEFAIMFENATVEEAKQFADQMLELLRAPFSVHGRDVFVNASIGIALRGSSAETADALVRSADVAMYQAKAGGKGAWSLYEPGMHVALLQRLELEADLRKAIERTEFVIHYQPVVCLNDGRVKSVEALVRWQHPRRGLVSPDEFIPVAEETGLIVPLDRWVVQQACRQLKWWHRSLPAAAGMSMNVNLSAAHLMHPELVEHIREVLAETQLDPRFLTLEITETGLLQDMTAAAQQVNELKDLGVRIAIDDFGTGYSSLTYLRCFDFDILKIDKSFIDDITGDSVEASLGAAIFELGRALSVEMCAEGIEVADQVDRLRALGCDSGQGYYFSKPLDAGGIASMLAAPAAEGLIGLGTLRRVA